VKIMRNAPEETEEADVEAGETVEIVLQEEEPATNGLIGVKYDPEVLTYVDTEETENALTSTHVNEEDGTITFAYAYKDEKLKELGDTPEELARIKFEAGCEDSKVVMTTEERGEDLEVGEEKTETAEGTGHDWQLDEFVWEGYESATASFTCANDETHQTSVKAKITSVTTDPTYDEDGSIVYTATVELDGVTYTDTKTEAIDKVVYEFTKGANGTWDAIANAGETYDVSVKRSYKDETTFAHFKELKMDGKVIAAANYTAEAGSLNVFLTADYMASLAEGEHVLSVVFDDATIDTKITVKAAEIPPTGDPYRMMPWAMLMMAALLGGIAVIFFSKEKEQI